MPPPRGLYPLSSTVPGTEPMSSGTEGLRSQGGTANSSPQTLPFCLSPNPNSRSFQCSWDQHWDLLHHNPIKCSLLEWLHPN